MNKPTNRCAGNIWNTYSYTSCGKSAAYEHDGKHYCKTHHPPTVEAKNKAKTEKWKREWEEKDAESKAAASAAASAAAEQKRRAECFPDLLAALCEFVDEFASHKLTETERIHKARAAIAKATGTP